jgi:hypothetical protein
MARKGSQKNERKANEKRVLEARRNEAEARRILDELRSRPIHRQTPDHAELIKRQAAILKRAAVASKKSETHSRKQKGGKR